MKQSLLMACCIALSFLVCSGASSVASGLLSDDQIMQVRGGDCSQCAHGNGLYCATGCAFSVQCYMPFCDSGAQHESCTKRNAQLEDWCTQRSQKMGCGELRERGTCTGYPSWRCTGGNKIGGMNDCPRSRAIGDPCP